VKTLPDKELLGGVFDAFLLAFYHLLGQFWHKLQKRTFVILFSFRCLSREKHARLSPTFTHTYSSTLIAKGENVKGVQELIRHASSRSTLEAYTQARAKAKRRAPSVSLH
jgi:site-specific recombinase XerD